MRHRRLAGLLVAGIYIVLTSAPGHAGPKDGAERCAGLQASGAIAWPEAGTRVLSATWRGSGSTAIPFTRPGMPPPKPVALPAHCELIGILHERTGVDGQPYAIRFHLRLPENWNERFFMEGSGGSDGYLGDAIGLDGDRQPAVAQGYAVLSQDSGHSMEVNTVPDRGGEFAFGFDPQARADYGGASLKASAEAGLAAVRVFYGKPPRRRYFSGSSKGGQEAMVLAQRYPDLFDGIVADAPGISIPRAGLAQVWDTRAFAAIIQARGETPSPANLATSFDAADFALVKQAILAACDRDDGVLDGMVGAYRQCTSAKVLPQLARVTCAGAKQAGCLSTAQVEALRRVHQGVRNAKGAELYAPFPWDGGWADMEWRLFKIGADEIPALGLLLGGAQGLGGANIVPPTAVASGPQPAMDFIMRFDLDRDGPRIYAKDGVFTRSAWQDYGARSPDLAAFRRRGGKMIVVHGLSDPIFSAADTMAWYEEVAKRQGGRIGDFVRLFPVPGRLHGKSGSAAADYDGLAALVRWVEQGEAPDRIEAAAGPTSPWPGRTRPLCPYPSQTHYKGSGDIETSDSFICE